MTETLMEPNDTATELQRLARLAEPVARAKPDLAEAVLQRRRRQLRRRRNVAGVCGAVLVAAAVAASTRPGQSHFFTMTQRTQSMAPTVPEAARVVFSRHLVAKRGDVVVVQRTQDGRTSDAVKRVVAAAGDTISCPAGADGRCSALLLNGSPLTEAYLRDVSQPPFPAMSVPSGKVFVIGDNRSFSMDSRQYGPVATSSIRGVAVRMLDAHGHPGPVPGAPRHEGPDKGDAVDPPGPTPPALTVTEPS